MGSNLHHRDSLLSRFSPTVEVKCPFPKNTYERFERRRGYGNKKERARIHYQVQRISYPISIQLLGT